MKLRDAFDGNDVDVLVDALCLIPNLAIVAHAAKRVAERLRYPIESRDQLMALLDNAVDTEFDGRTISASDIERYVPDEYFPIDDQRALMCRLLIAFQRGDLFHEHELEAAAAAKPTKLSRETTVIPMPSETYRDVERI